MRQSYKIFLFFCFGTFFLLATPVQILAADAPATTAPPTVESLEDVQREVQKSVNEILSATGAVISGVSSGMLEGAQQIQEQLDSADGTRLVGAKKSLTELLHVSVLRTEDMGNNAWRVTLAIKNDNEFPLRLVNLTAKNAILLLDGEGFAHEPKSDSERSRTLTIAGRTAVKLPLEFTELEAKPKQIRLFDVDFPVQ